MAILVRPLHARRTGRTVATTALLIASLLAGACTTREERIQHHLERADAYLAEGLGTEAVLELRNAAQLAPDDLGIILRVANISADQGFLGDAIDFFRDANQLAPEDGDIAIKLARVLLIEEPERSLQLMDGLIEREPENVGALIVRAHAAVAGDDLVRAVRDVELARQLDPDDPEVSWGQARVYEARIKAAK
jgi:cytochrome c-type biogenesis protein CcmH/NrfG